MRKYIIALPCIIVLPMAGMSQDADIYTDAAPNLVAEWSNGGTFTAGSTKDASEGTKCIEYSYNIDKTNKDPLELGLRSPTAAYHDYLPADKFKYIQFAVKATHPENISNAELSFWCIHCIGGTDTHFDTREKFTLTTSWQVISKPMSIWLTADNPLKKASVITLWFGCNKSATTKEGAIYIDDVKFTNTEVVAVKQSAYHDSPRVAGEIFFQKSGAVKIETYALNGTVVSSRIIEVAANTVYQPSKYSAGKLPAGAYVIRQSALEGERVSALDADRLMVVGK
jgi:hypothetical protein